MKVSAPTTGPWGGTWTGCKLCGVCCVVSFFPSSMCFFMFNGKFFCMEVIWKSVKREAKRSHCVTFLNIC